MSPPSVGLCAASRRADTLGPRQLRCRKVALDPTKGGREKLASVCSPPSGRQSDASHRAATFPHKGGKEETIRNGRAGTLGPRQLPPSPFELRRTSRRRKVALDPTKGGRKKWASVCSPPSAHVRAATQRCGHLPPQGGKGETTRNGGARPRSGRDSSAVARGPSTPRGGEGEDFRIVLGR